MDDIYCAIRARGPIAFGEHLEGEVIACCDGKVAWASKDIYEGYYASKVDMEAFDRLTNMVKLYKRNAPGKWTDLRDYLHTLTPKQLSVLVKELKEFRA